LTRDFADIIEVQLYGDHSNDEFRMIWDDSDETVPTAHAVSSVLVSAGVTPRKHCNPSWRLFEVSNRKKHGEKMGKGKKHWEILMKEIYRYTFNLNPPGLRSARHQQDDG